MAVFFENISYEIRKVLRGAKSKIVICVAWIDLDIYYQDLLNALDRGVMVRILVTESAKIKKYAQYICELTRKGSIFEEIILGRAINCMHNKIAIIDDEFVISGSYNWTHNADNNFENVSIESKTPEEIMKYLFEIDRISRMNYIGIQKLIKTERCSICGSEMMNVIIYDEVGRGTLVKICSNDTGHYVNTEEEIGCLLPTILNSISDEEEWMIEHRFEEEQIYSIQYEYELKRKKAIDEYIWSLKIPIHAVGVVTISTDFFNAGEKVIKMIWFNKSCASKLEKEYDDSFEIY